MSGDLAALLREHDGCTWRQVGPCVWCEDHDIRLFQGDLPEPRRTTPRCAPEDHDWDADMGMGFYYRCRTCGEIEWTE